MGETKSGVDGGAARRAEFGRAVELALDGRPMAWLGAAIALEVGKSSPLTQSAISQWINGKTDPEREYVFAAERVLELPAGALSRILGYLPVNAVPTVGVLDALNADTKVPKNVRAALRAAYLSSVSE